MARNTQVSAARPRDHRARPDRRFGDNAIHEASADVTAILKTGRRVHVFVKNAIGWMQNPLTDAMLEAKFHGMCDAVMGGSRCGALIDAAWGLGAAADVEALVGLASVA